MIDCLSSRKGDYCRYMAEYKTNDKEDSPNERDVAAKKASDAYKEAQSLATTAEDKTGQSLPSTHPIRLG